MKIDNLGGVGGAGKVAKPKTGGDGSFSKLLDGADNEKQTAAVSGASKLAATNFIQMIDGIGTCFQNI